MTFIVGLLFILIAILVGKFHFYNLIAGYNTATKKQKDSIDIKGFGKMFSMTFLLMGLSFIIIGFFIYKYGDSIVNVIAHLYTITIGVLYLFINGNKYKKGNNTYSTKGKRIIKILYSVVFASLLFVATLFYFILKSPSYSINKNKFEANSIYGFELAYTDVLTIDTFSTLPNIYIKYNGYRFNNIYKGYTVYKGDFRADNGLTVKLILFSDISPYIKITTKTNDNYYFNLKDRNETLLLFQELNSRIDTSL